MTWRSASSLFQWAASSSADEAAFVFARAGGLEIAGGGGGGVTAALVGGNAYRSFQDGDVLRGTGYAVSALGGATTGWTGVGVVVGAATFELQPLRKRRATWSTSTASPAQQRRTVLLHISHPRLRRTDRYLRYRRIAGRAPRLLPPQPREGAADLRPVPLHLWHLSRRLLRLLRHPAHR